MDFSTQVLLTSLHLKKKIKKKKINNLKKMKKKLNIHWSPIKRIKLKNTFRKFGPLWPS